MAWPRFNDEFSELMDDLSECYEIAMETGRFDEARKIREGFSLIPLLLIEGFLEAAKWPRK